MTTLTNRKARRAQRSGRREIEVGIYIVPMDLVRDYYQTQIAIEGYWNDRPPVIVVQPVTEMFRADDAWFKHTLSQMHEVRRPGAIRYVVPCEGGQVDIDIGLIDVQIYFDGHAGDIDARLMTDANFREFKRLCHGELTTQTVIATAVHNYRPDGELTLHYHNLIFGLRKQVGPDEQIGQFDLLPLIRALGDKLPLAVIEEL